MSELLVVGSEQDNTRLDRFLADQYEEYTRSFLQKLIDQGNVSINGIFVKKSGIMMKFLSRFQSRNRLRWLQRIYLLIFCMKMTMSF